MLTCLVRDATAKAEILPLRGSSEQITPAAQEKEEKGKGTFAPQSPLTVFWLAVRRKIGFKRLICMPVGHIGVLRIDVEPPRGRFYLAALLGLKSRTHGRLKRSNNKQ